MANKRLNAVITIGGAVAGSLKSALGTTKSGLREVGAEIQKIEGRQRELNRVMREQEQLGRSGNWTRVGLAMQELDATERQINALRRKQRLLKSIDEAQDANLRRRAALRSKLGDTLAIGAAVALPTVGAVTRSSDFNYQLQVIGNTADMTGDQVNALGQEILKISDDTGQSAKTTQEAIGFLVAAGMELSTARASMRSIGRTATATASEIEDVSRAAFTLGDTMDISPERLQSALDILVQSGKEGNFEFRAMAQNIPQLGAAFKSLKMGGAEAVATMGAALQIARKGAGDEAEAANNLRNFLAKILSPDTLKKASKLGSNLYGVVSGAQKRGENPFEAALTEINRITKGGDQKLLGELFQDMQVQNFLRPMLQNLEEYQRIKRVALSSDGVVDRDFLKMSETTKQQWNEMSNAAGRAAIAVGTSLEPAVGKLAETLRPVFEGIASFTRENSKLVGGSIVVVGSLLAMSTAALAVGYAFTFIKAGALAVAAGALRLAPALRLVGTAFMFLGRMLLLNPIGLAVTGIATAAFLIYKYWDPIKEWFGNLWGNITATFNKALQWITTKIEWIGEKWNAVKALVGFGDDAPARTAAAALPEPPQMATARGAGASYQDSSQWTFHITQQPGQSAKELADEIERRRRARQGVQSRSLMLDPVTP